MTPERPQVRPMNRYTIAKAAKLLGIGRNTLYRWLDNGTFRVSELGETNYGHKGVFIYGHGILRVWDATVINN